MVRRLHKTLVDYLVIAISPALIMLLVGSLVFFLIEVFYQGNFQGRLQYIFALFVIGAVLIGRISIEDGRERASLFAAPLGIAILLAINKFVAFQGGGLAAFSFLINCGLIALVWWSADKLTWDCTLIDESEEDAGEGLLEAVGLDAPGKAALQKEIAPQPPQPAEVESSPAAGWWQRFIERRRRPHAPGVWVVYFSLAAVALFGLGQLFIPAGDLPARRFAFFLLCIYTASGLGLLLTTSFLGLRRYLRQRRREMPLAMVNVWLATGAVLIAAVMLAATLLPRPNAEYAISELPFHFGSPDQKSSPYGTGSDGVKDDQADDAAQSDEQQEQDKQRNGQQSDSADSDRPGGKKSEKGKPSKSDDQAPGKSEKGDASSPSQNRKESTSTESEGESQKNGEKSPDNRDKQKPQSTDEKTETGGEKPEKESQPRKDGASGSKGKDSGGRSTDAKSASNENRAQQRGVGNHSTATDFSRWRHRIDGFFSARFIKQLLYGIAALVVLFLMWRHRRELLAAIADFRRQLLDFWRRLFGCGSKHTTVATENEPAKTPARRFADFTNPFATGQAGNWPPERLVRCTFEAMEAWASEHGHPRSPEQTPHEFVQCLASNVPALAADAGLLADLYCQAAYAAGELSVASITRLSRLWRNLENS